ncbi:MAG: NAD(P)-dependent oxidoreductase [Lautropia sp.]
MKSTVGFIGLGAMGNRMVTHLADSGNLVVYDTDVSRTRDVAEKVGGKAAASLNDFSAATTVILMLPTSQIVNTVVRGASGQPGLFDLLHAGATIIDMSSSEPIESVENARLAKIKRLTFLDAPVSGGVIGAESAKLAIMAGGSDAEFATVRDLLGKMGAKIVHAGPVGSGHAIKALNNLLAATTFAATAEVFAIGAKFGLDPKVMLSVIDASSGFNFHTRMVWQKAVIERGFDFGFAMQLMDKDVRVAQSLIKAIDAKPAVSNAASAVWAQALAAAPDGADMTLLAKQIEEATGVQHDQAPRT